MAKYIVQGEAYLDATHTLLPVGSEVELPDTGPHSVPPAGWIDVELEEPVTAEEHAFLHEELQKELVAKAKADAKEKVEAARARKQAKRDALEAQAKADAKAKKTTPQA